MYDMRITCPHCRGGGFHFEVINEELDERESGYLTVIECFLRCRCGEFFWVDVFVDNATGEEEIFCYKPVNWLD